MTSTTHPEFGFETVANAVAAAFPDAIKGRTIVITGVNPKGLGFSSAEAFASQAPATLVFCGRTRSKLDEAVRTLKARYPSVQFKTLELDLGSQQAVRKAAEELMSWQDVSKVDILLNNAAVMDIPQRELTPEGLEMHFGINHIGHFLFTNLIMDKLVAAAESAVKGVTRIVNVSSRAVVYSPVRFSDLNHEKKSKDLPVGEQPGAEALKAVHSVQNLKNEEYVPMVAYGQSKTSNVLFGLGLNERLYEKHGILSIGLHPGGILTELSRYTDPKVLQAILEKWKQLGLTFKTLQQGSSTSLVAACDPRLALPARKGGQEREGYGAYLEDCQLSLEAPLWATNWADAERLWGVSEKIVGQQFAH